MSKVPKPRTARRTGGPLHFSASRQIPQPEWKVSDDGNGMLTGTLRTFIPHISGSTVNGGGGGGGGGGAIGELGSHPLNSNNHFSYVSGGSSSSGTAKRGQKHPYDSRLTCTDFTISYQGNDIAYQDANYIGLDGDIGGVEWEINCPTDEEPIETHPDFMKTTGEAGKGFEAVTKEGVSTDTLSPYWNPEVVIPDSNNGAFQEFIYSDKTIKKKLVGVKSYKVFRPVFKVSFSTTKEDYAKDYLSKVGKIGVAPSLGPAWLNSTSGQSSSGGGTVSGETQKDWMLTAVNVTERSGIYKVSAEYTLSGVGGWNTIIYKKV